MDFNDLEVDDILDMSKKPKKKVNAKKKGNRVELQLCKLLTAHFKEDFSRSVGSGNRWSQVGHMPSHAKKTLVGDICVPEGFLWVIESKGGYESDIDLNGVLNGGIARLDSFIEQSEQDAEQSGRKPLILWKRSRKPWLAMTRWVDMEDYTGLQLIDYYIRYQDWWIVSLEELLKNTPRGYWFDE